MDEELRSKRSRRPCRLGVRFLSLPPIASWRNAARDPSKVQVRVRLPARLPVFGVVVKQDHGTLASSSPGGGTRRLHSLRATIRKDSRQRIYSRDLNIPQSNPRGEIGHHGSVLRSSSGFESRRGRGPLRYEAARPKRRGAGLSIQSKRVQVPSRPPSLMRGP